MSDEALLYFDEAFESLQPQVVIVQIGINDLAMLSFYPEQRVQVVTTCKYNIQQLVMKIVALGAKVILTTIFPVGDVEMFFYSPVEVVAAVEEVNTYLYALVGPDVVIFDAHAILVADDGLTQPDYALDMLHLNQAGYQVLNRELARVLANGQ